MKTGPSASQTLLLWRVLAAGGAAGEAMQKDLGTKVNASERRELIRLGLLEEAKARGGSLKLTVTDAGWGWANEHLDAALPARAHSGISPLLQQWLTLLKKHLQKSGSTLADVFADSDTPGRPEGQTHRAAKSSGRDVDAIHALVRSTYLSLTGGRLKTRCLLRDLRERLSEIDRGQVDAAIDRMVTSGEAVLFRLDNRLEITPADEESAILAGGERRHILWIDR